MLTREQLEFNGEPQLLNDELNLLSGELILLKRETKGMNSALGRPPSERSRTEMSRREIGVKDSRTQVWSAPLDS